MTSPDSNKLSAIFRLESIRGESKGPSARRQLVRFTDRPTSRNSTLERESRDDLTRPRLRPGPGERVDKPVTRIQRAGSRVAHGRRGGVGTDLWLRNIEKRIFRA